MKMTDAGINRKCAEAMGMKFGDSVNELAVYPSNPDPEIRIRHCNGTDTIYDPLHNAEQCMELIKKFHLDIEYSVGGLWTANAFNVHGEGLGTGRNADLNRAVCECVASLGGK